MSLTVTSRKSILDFRASISFKAFPRAVSSSVILALSTGLVVDPPEVPDDCIRAFTSAILASTYSTLAITKSAVCAVVQNIRLITNTMVIIAIVVFFCCLIFCSPLYYGFTFLYIIHNELNNGQCASHK